MSLVKLHYLRYSPLQEMFHFDLQSTPKAKEVDLLRQQYQVSYNMAIEIVYLYLERIYQLNKHKGTSISKVEELFDLNIELKGLVDQLRQEGHDIDALIREKKKTLNIKYLYDKIQVNVDASMRNYDDPEKETMAGIGFSIQADGQVIHETCIQLDSRPRLPKLRSQPHSCATERTPATVNVVEYFALIHALEYLLENNLTANSIEIFSDSERAVQQVKRIYSTRSPHLIRLRDCVWELMDEFDNIAITHIPREENDHVDWMLCQFLDKLQGIERDRETRWLIRNGVVQVPASAQAETS